MLTRNWYNNMKASRLKQVITNGTVTYSGSYANTGYSSNNAASGFLLREENVTFSTSYTGIILGSGSTPATLDDYKLDSMITEGLSVNTVLQRDDENNLRYHMTITNISDEAITIGEVGLLSKAWKSADSGSANCVLVERTVLDAPMTIPADGVGILTYTVRMNVPEA